jgi:hypothetical protein
MLARAAQAIGADLVAARNSRRLPQLECALPANRVDPSDFSVGLRCGKADRGARPRRLGGRIRLEAGDQAPAEGRLPRARPREPAPLGRRRCRYLQSILARENWPFVLVGQSYGGAVITNAAAGNPDVDALVYVNAFVADIGEDILRRRL